MMASWSEPGSVFQPVRDARRLWEQSQPQLFIELPEAPRSPGAEPAAGQPPAVTTNTNGTRRPTCPGSAAGASQETS